MRAALIVASALATCSMSAFAADKPSARIIVQHAPLAGFVYYEGDALWDDMKVGDKLELVREAGNPHDINAVRLQWRGHMLGYVPRKDNADVARQLDRGARVQARITELTRLKNGRRRIGYDIVVPLQ